jgi:hypothetical protein
MYTAYLRAGGCKDVLRIHLAQGRDQLWAFVCRIVGHVEEENFVCSESGLSVPSGYEQNSVNDVTAVL